MSKEQVYKYLQASSANRMTSCINYNILDNYFDESTGGDSLTGGSVLLQNATMMPIPEYMPPSVNIVQFNSEQGSSPMLMMMSFDSSTASMVHLEADTTYDNIDIFTIGPAGDDSEISAPVYICGSGKLVAFKLDISTQRYEMIEVDLSENPLIDVRTITGWVGICFIPKGEHVVINDVYYGEA